MQINTFGFWPRCISKTMRSHCVLGLNKKIRLPTEFLGSSFLFCFISSTILIFYAHRETLFMHFSVGWYINLSAILISIFLMKSSIYSLSFVPSSCDIYEFATAEFMICRRVNGLEKSKDKQWLGYPNNNGTGSGTSSKDCCRSDF